MDYEKKYVLSGEPDKDTDYFQATKEQRDIFFSKMKDMGYKWDADEKEIV